MRLIGQLGEICLFSDRIEEGACPERGLQRRDRPMTPQGFTFAYGPSAGGLLESVGVDILTLGEYIMDVNVIPYKERRVRVRTRVEDVVLSIERINGNFSASHVIAFLSALEKGVGVDPPQEMKLGRIAEMELERIRNHLLVMQRVVKSAGFSVPSYQLLLRMERVNRVIGKVFGHRFLYGVNGPGYLRTLGELGGLEEIGRYFEDLFKKVLENRIFIDRLQSNGIVADREGIGPAARASSFKNDARLDGDYTEMYRELGFLPATAEGGDAFARFMVRGEEVKESLRILFSIKPATVEYRLKEWNGEGIGRVESPSGDIAYYVKFRGGSVTELHFLPPSNYNILAFSSSMVKNIFTDFPFNWESFGIWLSEVEVRLE